ncbi:MAG: TIGR04282 family arsenosugar biosynthesis glycosyltransferase [Chromatiales bacterium]|nr:TIGR04282 family arsenosugar biosynthesis glycosyltransferase [Chromatiales bacterium]
MSDFAVQVFARPPIAGQAKTRLISALGAQGAARVYEELLRTTVDRLAGAFGGALSLWVSGEPNHPVFQTLAAEHSLLIQSQEGADLGERMSLALRTGLERQDKVILVGSDCPPMDADYVKQALAALDAGADCVLGPAEDGGYVLVGLRKWGPQPFMDIPWGSAQVLAKTRERLRQAGWHWRELHPLWDLDRPEDLSRWRLLHEVTP